MAKQFACGDVVEGCAFKITAETEDEVMKQVAAHAAKDHALTDVTPELAAKVKAAIQTR